MTATAPVRTSSTGGRLVYAVGDIHGYSRQLAVLLERIAEDAARSAPAEQPLIVFIGDYVDRGPDSPGVIERILALEADGRFEVVCLMGNHEDALLRFLVDPSYAPAWIGNWGRATLEAYGVQPPLLPNDATCEAAQAAFRQAFPAAHRDFLGRLRISLTVGDYLFVHAGVRPGVGLELQAERDLIWIRYEFLESDADFGKVVVHGHTPEERPVPRANRINVDTGVYFTGVLTAVRLEGERRDFLQAG